MLNAPNRIGKFDTNLELRFQRYFSRNEKFSKYELNVIKNTLMNYTSTQLKTFFSIIKTLSNNTINYNLNNYSDQNLAINDFIKDIVSDDIVISDYIKELLDR